MSFGQPEITEEEIKCEECGKWFKKITSAHVKKLHDITIPEYKKKWGFSNSQPLEAFYIKKMRQEYNKLYNATEMLIKESKKNKGKYNFKKGHNSRVGIERSEQEKIHLRSICVNVQHTKSFRKKISISSKIKWRDPSYREKIGISLKKIWNEPERKIEQSKKTKKFWEDPINKKNMSEVRKKIWNTPEKKKYASERSKKYWASKKGGRQTTID